MKRFNKQNCTSSVRAQITDKWGRTITLMGTVASGSKAIMQIVYSAWYAYEHDNITEDFVMIEGSFV